MPIIGRTLTVTPALTDCRAPLLPTKVEDEYITYQKISMYMYVAYKVPFVDSDEIFANFVMVDGQTIQIMPCPRLTL